MSDQNSDLSGITQFFCQLISINWFTVRMLRNSNWLKQKSKIVTRYKILNSYLLSTMRQDHSSSDLKYSIINHCCLFAMLSSGLNGQYDQKMTINERFNVKNFEPLLHFINITIVKYFCTSCICSMVCYVLYTLHLTVLGILLLLHMLLCLVVKRTSQQT